MSLDTFGDATDWPNTPAWGKRTLPYLDDAAAEPVKGAPRQQGRRLPDKIMIAFHQACDVGDHDIAKELLRLVELTLMRKPMPNHAGRRRTMESLVAAHERLWNLCHPDAEG